MHHPLSRSLAADVDIAVIRIPHEAMLAPFEFSVEFVEYDVNRSVFESGSDGERAGESGGGRDPSGWSALSASIVVVGRSRSTVVPVSWASAASGSPRVLRLLCRRSPDSPYLL